MLPAGTVASLLASSTRYSTRAPLEAARRRATSIMRGEMSTPTALAFRAASLSVR